VVERTIDRHLRKAFSDFRAPEEHEFDGLGFRERVREVQPCLHCPTRFVDGETPGIDPHLHRLFVPESLQSPVDLL
jgi:hypothetical protein